MIPGVSSHLRQRFGIAALLLGALSSLSAAAAPIGGDLTGNLPLGSPAPEAKAPAAIPPGTVTPRSAGPPPQKTPAAPSGEPSSPGDPGDPGDPGERRADDRGAGARDPVAVPQPSAQALRRFRTGNVWWLVTVAWGLAVPAAWLFSGLSARLRGWAQRVTRRWFAALLLYFAAYALTGFCVDLPPAFYLGFLREHAYGLSNQTAAKWLADTLETLVLTVAGGAALLWLPYLLLRRSPRRWWLYAGLATAPLLVVVLLVSPLWIDPLFNRFGPLEDKALEADIIHLAARAGIPGSRIFVVNKSADTKELNASVDGFLATRRIVLWDTLLAKLDRREILSVAGHEMGHYVLGHTCQGIGFLSLLVLAALYLVHRSAAALLARFGGRFGFTDLADFASLPLLELLLGVFLLLLAPVALGFSRHLEHEADRFGLELTRDNRAAATALVKLQQTNLAVPRPGALYKLWRSSHPPLGERIDFCNSYRPWERGEPLRYRSLFRGAEAAAEPPGSPQLVPPAGGGLAPRDRLAISSRPAGTARDRK
jgi:STE24 endopeptidase